MKENKLQKMITDYINYLGGVVLRVNSGCIKMGGRVIRLAPAGTSDLIGLLPGGRFIAIETKQEKNSLSDVQKLFFAKVWAAGGVAICAKEYEQAVTEINKAIAVSIN